MAVALVFVRRAIGVTLRDLAHASRASCAVTLATALVPAAIVAVSPSGFALDWLQTGLAVLGGAAGWCAGLWAFNHPVRGEMVGIWRLVADRAGAARPALSSE